MNTILVPLDGSPRAELSLTPACDLARLTGATIVLVHAIPFFNGRHAKQVAERVSATEALDYLATVQCRLGREGLAVQTETLPGNPFQTIQFAALKHDADLIAMTTHGRTGIQSALMGSVAVSVLQRSECPVLLVPARTPDASVPSPIHRRILVPLDGTPLSEAALAYVTGEGLARGAETVLLRVVGEEDLPGMLPVSGFVGPEIIELAEAQVTKQRTLVEEYLRCTAELYLVNARRQVHVGYGNPASEITTFAANLKVSLIVMATAGRHGFDRLVHGSVAGQVLRHSPVPILLVHDLRHR
ncbi:MAG: UspA domain protein [Chloroflexi bacterium]|nr:UspA domain protein [Chloroflexota bacterium]